MAALTDHKIFFQNKIYFELFLHDKQIWSLKNCM